MPLKTIRRALVETLEDLTRRDFDKFCYMLVDRRGEPRVRRYRVEGRNFLDIVDLMVSTFTERGALEVAVEILSQIECNEMAQMLAERPSAGAIIVDQGKLMSTRVPSSWK